jgi:hypothetical protein
MDFVGSLLFLLIVADFFLRWHGGKGFLDTEIRLTRSWRRKPGPDPVSTPDVASPAPVTAVNHAPRDWSDKAAWNHYFKAELSPGAYRSHGFLDAILMEHFSLAQEKGGRVWFPGCGVQQCPKVYAERGCKVLATDFSSVAVAYQRSLAAAMLQAGPEAPAQGSLTILEHDFTLSKPEGEFDLILNCRAFQGLSGDAMTAAAAHFYAALRPGGICILVTMNVQGSPRRNQIEDYLIGAGFYVPWVKTNRWYREKLDSTGIVYGMLMGRPRIPNHDLYPREHFREYAERDQKILDSFRDEYESRLKDEEAETNATYNSPTARVAIVEYGTG